MADEVAQLRLPSRAVRRLAVEAEPPGEVEPVGLLPHGLDQAGLGLDLGRSPGEASFQQGIGLAPHSVGDLVEGQFGMVLHAPERTAVAADLGGLDRAGGVAGERQGIPARQGLDLVAVDGSGIIGGRPSVEQRVTTPLQGRCDPPGEADLVAAGVGPHRPARRNDRELQARAGSETRHAGPEHGPHEVQVRPYLWRIRIGVHRRPGQEHGVVAFDGVGRAGAFGRTDIVEQRRREDIAQGVDEAFAAAPPGSGPSCLAGLGRLAFGDQQLQPIWHVVVFPFTRTAAGAEITPAPGTTDGESWPAPRCRPGRLPRGIWAGPKKWAGVRGKA